MARPDFREMNILLKSLQLLDTAFTGLMDEEAQRKTVRSACSGMVLDQSREAMKQVPIEELSKSRAGIRVSLLKEAGFQTLHDIAVCEDRRLHQIDGIGDKQIEAIRNILAEFHNGLVEFADVRIDPEDPSKENRALVTAIARFLLGQRLRQDNRALYEEVHRRIKGIEEGAVITRRVQWIFGGRERRRSTEQAYEAMVEFAQSEAHARSQQLIRAYGESMKVSEDDAMAMFQRQSAEFYAVLESVTGGHLEKPLIYSSIPAKLAADIDAVELDLSAFRGTLRLYQAFGVKYILHQKKVLLGDEMGLGKTVQAIGAMANLSAEAAAEGAPSYFLVVCPASVLINWCREIAKFSTIPVQMIYGPDREAQLKAWRLNGGAAVTNYETMWLVHDFINNRMKLNLMVVDEAHYIKNPDAKRSRFIRDLEDESERILLMTGTPLENRVSEMCSLIDFIRPEMSDKIRSSAILSHVPEFRELVAPVYLRRLREDVLEELPPIEEKLEWCSMTDIDKLFYVRYLYEENFSALRRVSFHQDDLTHSAKGLRLRELCDQVREENRKTVIFSYFRETIRRVEEFLGDRCSGTITGSTPPANRQRIIDAFTEAPVGSVLVCQVQAGGTGLNIQAASVVIFCEPQIKPSLTHQSLSRVYRMGQIRNVLVYHLLCEHTVDEAVLRMLETKQQEFDAFADESAMAE
ncbi:MAG: DEAD/DEAH box helicase, partial [Mogibacterium sp.]|nr:DEAD/DEAH box helicase [Mogibacterium sp.]